MRGQEGGGLAQEGIRREWESCDREIGKRESERLKREWRLNVDFYNEEAYLHGVVHTHAAG